MQEILCAACGGAANGYKCTKCDFEHKYFDEQHECGSEHLMAKCIECNEGEMDCTCAW